MTSSVGGGGGILYYHRRPGALVVVVVLILLVVLVSLPQHEADRDRDRDQDQYMLLYTPEEYLSVPTATFVEALRSTLTDVNSALSVVSQFASAFQDFRLSNAITDCIDLLDLSSDELSWTLYATQAGKSNKTRNLGADMKTSLSAALVNQDTCIEGFQGTGSFVGPIIAASLTQLTSLVRQALNMVQFMPMPRSSAEVAPYKNNNNNNNRIIINKRKQLLEEEEQQQQYRQHSLDSDGFPYWISHNDRKLLLITRDHQAQQANLVVVVVAKDGTGNFTKISDAISAAPNHNPNRFIIYVKRGTYDEVLEIKRKKPNIMIYGDGISSTIITGNRSVLDGYTTYRSATLGVSGAGFIARDLTIQNTAGPERHQAVAFRSDSDLSAIYRVAFKGYQDTLYAHSNRQFFRECTVEGTVDFIFGDSVALLQGCDIRAIKGLPNQKNTVTAQGRKDPGENTGFSLQMCNITAAADADTNSTGRTTYLGRPWKKYSRTVIMESYISGAVHPKGWLEWNADLYLDTLFYAEYNNRGPGAALQNRVRWPGYRVFNTTAEASNYTVTHFLQGDLWLPETGVSYDAGLI